MKFFIGDNLRLAGKTRHGKNRIRENGDLWEVTNLDGQDSSILSTKDMIPIKESRRSVEMVRSSMKGDRCRSEWRWLDLPSDEHMEIIEHIQ